MKTYTFIYKNEIFATVAANYCEALAALIFHSGNEKSAALWIFSE